MVGVSTADQRLFPTCLLLAKYNDNKKNVGLHSGIKHRDGV